MTYHVLSGYRCSMANDNKSESGPIGNTDPSKRGRGGEPPKNPKTDPPAKPSKDK